MCMFRRVEQYISIDLSELCSSCHTKACPTAELQSAVLQPTCCLHVVSSSTADDGLESGLADQQCCAGPSIFACAVCSVHVFREI